jgi:hypothetical protein
VTADALEHVNDRRDVERVLNLVEGQRRAATAGLSNFAGGEQ